MSSIAAFEQGRWIGKQVATWRCEANGNHKDAAHIVLTSRIAQFLGGHFVGRLEEIEDEADVFIVPRTTLSGDECSRGRPLVKEDFFGGRIPFEILGTKAIMHPAAGSEQLPDFWPLDFVAKAHEFGLRGYTAFSPGQVWDAGRRLLSEVGTIRLKAVHASGGEQQHAVCDEQELRQALDQMTQNGRLCDVVVLEEDLRDTATYSVGVVSLGGSSFCYHGTQHSTTNNDGLPAYGGTTIEVHRGDMEALLDQCPEQVRKFVHVAAGFDDLALSRLPGLVASRRNYDVIEGLGSDGDRRLALLEQSWRAGGASGAEIAAMEVFAQDKSVRRVRASTVERYGNSATAPADATIYFSGTDPVVGRLMKYAIVEEIGF